MSITGDEIAQVSDLKALSDSFSGDVIFAGNYVDIYRTNLILYMSRNDYESFTINIVSTNNSIHAASGTVKNSNGSTVKIDATTLRVERTKDNLLSIEEISGGEYCRISQIIGNRAGGGTLLVDALRALLEGVHHGA